MIFWRRLVGVDIDGSAGDLAAGQCIGERLFVVNPAARDVERDRAVLHLRNLRRAQHPARFIAQGCVHGDDVGLCEQLVERHHLGADFFADRLRNVRVIRQDAHAECAGAGRDARADAAQSDDAQDLAGELDAQEFRAVPLPALHAGVRLRNVAAERQHHRHRVLGRGEDVRGRRVDHQNSALGAGVDIDVVEPHSRPSDDPQALAGVDELARDGRAAPRDERIRLRDRAKEFCAFESRTVIEIDIGCCAQNREARFRECVGHQYPMGRRHALATSVSASSIRSSASSGTSPMCPMRNVIVFQSPYPPPMV